MGREWVIGLFALAGAFLGAYFTRQAQHHKWLLERRSEAFGKLLECVEEANNKAFDVLHNSSIDAGVERNLAILNAYRPVFNQTRIVRLYLPKQVRTQFSESVKRYWALHTDPQLGHKRFRSMDEELDRIQELFEQELTPHFWLRTPYLLMRRLTERFRS